jgi:hypothetical protein
MKTFLLRHSTLLLVFTIPYQPPSQSLCVHVHVGALPGTRFHFWHHFEIVLNPLCQHTNVRSGFWTTFFQLSDPGSLRGRQILVSSFEKILQDPKFSQDFESPLEQRDGEKSTASNPPVASWDEDFSSPCRIPLWVGLSIYMEGFDARKKKF